MDNKKQSYDIVYKNSAGRNLIVYTFIDQAELVNYQLEMLANNRINGLLKSEVMRINGEIHLQFDITSLVTVKKLFERRKFSRRDFLCLIKQTVEILETMERYLLDNSRIVFDSTYIFVDPQNLKLGYAYLPIKDRPQSLDELKDLLLDAIISDIRFIDEPSDDYIQRLIEILKDPEFEESSLKKYLNEVDRVKAVPIHNGNTERDLPKPKKEDNNQLTPRQKEEWSVNRTVKIKRMYYPVKSYIVLFSVIGMLFLFCVTLVLSGILSPRNPDSLLSLFGFILIGGAVTYLIYSKLFTPDKKIERVVEERPDKTERDIEERHNKIELLTGKEYVNKAFSVPMHRSTDTYNESTAQKEAASTLSRAPLLMPKQNMLFAEKNEMSEIRPFNSSLEKVQIQDKTLILNASNLNLPYLKRMLGNSIETIVIEQLPFMMGRLEGQVDYCVNNPAIGKLHAEITKRSESYFISDMNSRNGTIINGVRIEPTNEKNIKDGDRITLGNEDFIFYCGNAD